MQVAIIGNRRCWHAGMLAGALERRGAETAFFSPQRLKATIGERPYISSCGEETGGIPASLDEFDAVAVRSVPGGSLEQVIFRVDVLHRLENAGIPVVNPPGCIEKSVDKYYTSTLLEDRGLPTPRTVVTERFEEAMAAFWEMKDVIVKPLFGSLGLGMVRITDEDTAHRVFRTWQACRYVYYIQQFIPHGNSDIRAFVVGSGVIAAMTRSAGGWRTNISRGATACSFNLTPSLEELCLRAVTALGAGYLGVDLLVDTEGFPYVIEANSVPGWKGLQEVASVDIAGEIADYIIGAARGKGAFGGG